MPANSNCTRCPLHEHAKSVCVWGEGPQDADIFVIGEAPGEVEDQLNRPFVGEAGVQLNAALERAGLHRDQVRVSNLVRCRPEGNRTPTPEEQRACISYLIEEIETVKPRVIVALGGSALKAITGKDSITRERGKLLQSKTIRLGSSLLLATWHPAYYLHKRDPSILTQLTADLQLAKRTAYGESQKDDPTVIHILPGAPHQELQDALDRLGPAKAVACDLEWTGGTHMYWPWTPGSQPYSISITGRIPSGLVSVGIAHPSRAIRPQLQEFFATHPIVGHNVQSDLIWLIAMGYQIRVAGDTMLLANLLDEGQPMGLEQLAATYTDMQLGWKKPVWPRPPADDAEWHQILSHNTGDTQSTFLLIEALYRELGRRPPDEQQNIRRMYQHIMLPAAVTFAEVALSGTGVDLQLLEQNIEEAEAARLQHGRDYGAVLGTDASTAIAVALSPQKTLRVLREQFNLPVVSTREDDLLEYADHEAVRLTQGVRHENKNLSTYFLPWRKLALESGRIHTVYRLTGARSGRLSAELEEGGSIQVAPREDRVRRVVRAQEGWKIVAADESQLELRLVASPWFANERRMLELFQNPKNDLHRTTAAYSVAYRRDHLSASRFWPIRGQYETLVTDDERQAGKGQNFGLVYTMAAPKLKLYLLSKFGVHVTLEEAEMLHQGYFELYPDILTWHERTIAEFNRRGYAVTPLGRYRRHIDKAHVSINTVVQAVASDITLLSMNAIRNEIQRRRLLSFLIGFVHDSVLAESPPDEVEEVREIMRQYLEHPPVHLFGIDAVPVPLKADFKIGDSWAA